MDTERMDTTMIDLIFFLARKMKSYPSSMIVDKMDTCYTLVDMVNDMIVVCIRLQQDNEPYEEFFYETLKMYATI